MSRHVLAAPRLALAAELEEEGLGEVLHSLPLGGRNPKHVRAGLLGRVRPSMARLLRLFVLGQSVRREELPATVVAALEPFVESGLGVMTEDAVALRGLTLTLVEGLWYLSELPSPQQTLYYGADSLALLNRLHVRAGRALDLCSGPGVIGLVVASRGMPTVGVELNPLALNLATVNARLNGLHEDYLPRLGDLYAPLDASQEFEMITCNPPLVPIPAGLPFPFVGNGGPLGMDVTWRVLEGLPAFLAPQGVCHTLGVTLGSAGDVLARPRLEEVAAAHDLHLRITVTGAIGIEPTNEWCRATAWSILAGQGIDTELIGTRRAEVAEEVSNGYAREGADRVLFYYLRVTRGRPGVDVHHLAQSRHGRAVGGWYVDGLTTMGGAPA